MALLQLKLFADERATHTGRLDHSSSLGLASLILCCDYFEINVQHVLCNTLFNLNLIPNAKAISMAGQLLVAQSSLFVDRLKLLGCPEFFNYCEIRHIMTPRSSAKT